MKSVTPWLAPIIQLLIALSFIGLFYAISWFGQTYTFKASAYEPYDPIYSDQIYLEYEALKGHQKVEPGTVYVSFKSDQNGYATIDKVSSKPFSLAVRGNYSDRQIYIDELSSYQVKSEARESLRGKSSFELEVDISPWGMTRIHTLRPHN